MISQRFKHTRKVKQTHGPMLKAHLDLILPLHQDPNLLRSHHLPLDLNLSQDLDLTLKMSSASVKWEKTLLFRLVLRFRPRVAVVVKPKPRG